MGQTFIRVEFAPNGYLPPHRHRRASEIIYILEGTMEVGFVTSYPAYKYYSKVLNKGDAIMIPFGLVHTVRNVASEKCVITVSFKSQNPGFIYMPDSVFTAKPAINSTYLAGAFKLDEKTVKDLQTKMWYI
ncbi:germin-like protein subfamily 1 member 11 [Salvia splendens]|nr:germin-like protein subfamily 1 member 11 [Salvia splendens]